MSYRVEFIATVITFLLIIERVHCEDNIEGDVDAYDGFFCEKVITNIDYCEKDYCPTKGVKMRKKCNSSYANDRSIKQKCEAWPIDKITSQNQFLTLPVINAEKGIAYWNMYCALCNFDDEFEFEDSLLHFVTIESCGLAEFLNFNLYLEKSHISKRANSYCYGNASKIIQTDLLKSEYLCDEKFSLTEFNNLIYGTDCDINSSVICPKLPFRNDLRCTYGSEYSKTCQEDYFLFEGINFAYGENGKIYVPQYRRKFLRSEYSNVTGVEGLLYLCTRETSRFHPLEIVAIFAYFVSILFFVLFIILNSNKQCLKNLPNRTLYSFCITQLAYSFLNLNFHFPTFSGLCIATDFMYRSIALSSILWNLVVFFEYSRVIYFLIRKVELSTDVQLIKYSIYCLLCWILPAIPTIFAMFIIVIGGEKSSSCPEVEGLTLTFCGFDEKSHPNADLLFQTQYILVSLGGNILVMGCLGIILVIIYLSWQNTIRSNGRNYSVMFKKTSLICVIISVHFAFNLVGDMSEPDIGGLFYYMFEVFDGCMGVLIFCTFYYKKNTLKNILAMTRNSRRTPSTENIEINEYEGDDVSMFSRE